MRAFFAGVLLLVFLAAVVWSATPPFPKPGALVNMPYRAIAAELGAPLNQNPNPDLPELVPSTKSVVWVKPWLLATWKLSISYGYTAFDMDARPDGVSRCLETQWNWVNLMLPCEAVFHARLVSS